MAIEIKVDVSGSGNLDNINDSINEASKSAKSLKQQFIEARKELMAMDESDPGFIKKAAEAGRLKDQISDMNAVIKATAGSTTENLGNALGGVASIGIGAFQGITAAQALFGAESEDLQKILVKLQAAAAMADAIRTFGQFGDTITQVKASLGAVLGTMIQTTAATGAHTAATGADIVATEGATVAQVGLNTAMLANPIFLVVAAIGALVAAYVMFADSSSEAEEAEKKRQKAIVERQKAQEKASKEESKTLAGMQSGFKMQIGLLSRTNAGSKERLDLIKTINKEYGTTLKNLSDENEFQKQLSSSLNEFLKLKRIEYQVKKNEKYFDSLMAKEEDARKAMRKEGIKVSEKEIDMLIKITDEKERGAAMDELLRNKYPNKTLSQVEPELKALVDVRLKQEEVMTSTYKLKSANDILTESNNNVTTSTTKQKDEYKLLAEEANAAEEDLKRSRTKRTGTRIEELDLEKNITLANIKQEYETQKKNIENTVTDAAKKSTALRKLEENYGRWIVAYTTQIQDETDAIINDTLEKRRKYYAELLLAEQTLQKEITFGNNDTTDTLESLKQRERKIRIDSINDEIAYSNMSVKEKKLALQEVFELQQEYNQKELEGRLESIQTERNFQMGEVVKYYDNMDKYTISKDEETGKYRVDLNQSYLDELSTQGKKAQDDAMLEADAVQNVINQTSINLDKEANTKKLEANAEFNAKKKELSIKTDQEILNEELSNIQKRKEKIQEYIDGASEIAGAFFEWGNRMRQEESDDELSKYKEGTAEYEAAKKTQTQVAEKAAERQFYINKAFQLASAINDGTGAVLTSLKSAPPVIGTIPNPAGIAALAFVTATSVARIAKIAASKYKSTSTSGVGGDTGGTNVTSTPQVNLFGNPNNLNTVNATTNKPVSNNNQPIVVKAYVSETDITDSQKRVTKYKNAAEL